MPVRFTLLLFAFLVLFLLVLGNPGAVTLKFLFWTAQLRVYEVIIGSVVFGIVFSYLYLGHWKYLRKVRTRKWD
ncbi:MAG: LapA family protein [Leptospiraceae bacterium]|nr:LapA family protein [Leptospiraceae bacterium]